VVTGTENYILIFSHTHVWVNDGSWQSYSNEERAILSAHTALRLELGYRDKIDRLIVDYEECLDGHVEVCSHITVRFYVKSYSQGLV
jgi:hypothetical protein